MNYNTPDSDKQFNSNGLVPELPFLNDVPTVLKPYPNWVCWTYHERGGKLSRIPASGQGNLEDIYRRCQSEGYGLGFNLSPENPISVICIGGYEGDDAPVPPDTRDIIDIAKTYITKDEILGELYLVGYVNEQCNISKNRVSIHSDKFILPITHNKGLFPDIQERTKQFETVARRYCSQSWMEKLDVRRVEEDEESALGKVLTECLDTPNWLRDARRTELWEFLGHCWMYPALQVDILQWLDDNFTSKEKRTSIVATIESHVQKKDSTPNKEKKSRRGHRNSKPLLNGAEEAEELPWSDYTNAAELVASYGENIHYCYPWKKWLIWVETHWQSDESGAISRLAKHTIKRLAAQLEKVDDPKTFLAHIKRSLSNASLNAMVECARSEEGIPIQPDDLDKNEWFLNCANGTLDLRTGLLMPHDRRDYITHCITTEYDPDAECPVWDAFLWRIMGGSVDSDSPDDNASVLEERDAADARAQALIDFLQKIVGYSLTGDTSEECLFILYGSGQNGKSKFMGALQDLLQTYSQSTHSKTFMVNDHSDAIPNDIARLRGARLVSSSELGKDRRLNEELVKRATGRDPMTARFLRAEFFDFLPQFKLFMATNHLPKISSVDKSLWRRIHQIPFTVTIPDEEKDPYLGDKLRDELPGILAWAVRGCLRWQKEGLNPPNAVKEATESYKSSMDTVGRFLDEQCTFGDRFRIRGGELYKAYDTWCSDNHERAERSNAFFAYLDARGIEKKQNNGMWRIGMGLLTTKPEHVDK